MKMKHLFILLLIFLSINVMASEPKSFYDYSVLDRKGNEVTMRQYEGKVLLIVNTATRCGFTPQYEELEALYKSYSHLGLEILDFPCNQFGQQAPGSEEEIHSFCQLNYGTEFPQFKKLEVNGDNASPLFVYLKNEQPFKGFDVNHPIGKILDEMLSKADPNYKESNDIKWNFTKFLVSSDGRVVARFEPTEDMKTVEAAVKEQLGM